MLTVFIFKVFKRFFDKKKQCLKILRFLVKQCKGILFIQIVVIMTMTTMMTFVRINVIMIMINIIIIIRNNIMMLVINIIMNMNNFIMIMIKTSMKTNITTLCLNSKNN